MRSGGPLLAIGLAFAVLGACGASTEPAAVAHEKTSLDLDPAFQPAGPITDAGQVFEASEAAALAAKLEAHNASTRHPIVVASVPSLGGRDIQSFSDSLASRWKVGQDDRGVLLLIAPEERQIWMSVADGTLPLLPNEESQAIVDSLIVPAFRQGDFYLGTNAAIDAVIERVN